MLGKVSDTGTRSMDITADEFVAFVPTSRQHSAFRADAHSKIRVFSVQLLVAELISGTILD